MPPKTARQLDRFSQFGLVAGRLALEDAGLEPGRRRRRRIRERIGIYLGSALGGIAYAEEQHERYLEKGIRQVAPNLALAVFGGAAPANLGIALDVRGPILSTANSCASGAVALGEALGDLREGRVDAAIAGGCEIPLSPLAFGAFDIIRALSAGHNADPAHAARPFDTGRDGFVMGEGAALLVLEAADIAERRGADAVCRAARLRRHVGRLPHGPAPGRWSEAARAATIASPTPPSTRPRSTTSTPTPFDAHRRPGRGPGDRPRSRRAGGDRAGERHQGALRSSAWCLGRDRGGDRALAIRDGWVPASVNLEEPVDPEIRGAFTGAAAGRPRRCQPARAVLHGR